MKCNLIAEGIIKAAADVNLKIPLVVRLNGTNAKEGKEMLENFTKKGGKLNITVANDIGDGGKKAVEVVNKVKRGEIKIWD